LAGICGGDLGLLFSSRQLQAAAGKDNFEAVAFLIPRLEASKETKAAVRNALRQHEEETGHH